MAIAGHRAKVRGAWAIFGSSVNVACLAMKECRRLRAAVQERSDVPACVDIEELERGDTARFWGQVLLAAMARWLPTSGYFGAVAPCDEIYGTRKVCQIWPASCALLCGQI